jgi:hypothetical protein
MKRPQAETAVNNTGQAAAELDAFPPSPRLRWTGLPAILQSSPGFHPTGDHAFIRLHPISAGQEGEL